MVTVLTSPSFVIPVLALILAGIHGFDLPDTYNGINNFDDLYENQGFNNLGQQNQGIFNPFNDDLYENPGFNPFLQNQGQFNPFLQNQAQFNPFLNPFNNPLGNVNNPFSNPLFGLNNPFNPFDKRK